MHNFPTKFSLIAIPIHWLNKLINYKGIQFPYKVNSKTFLAISLWHLWTTRNKNLYEHKEQKLNPYNVLNQAIEHEYMAGSKHMHANRVPLHLRWIPPKINYYKLNTDGATSSEKDTNGIRGVIRNHVGDWMVGFASPFPHVHCITAELQALIKGLSIAIQMQLMPLEVEIDAKEVTTLLGSEISKYSNLIFDCRHLLRILHDPVIGQAYRE